MSIVIITNKSTRDLPIPRHFPYFLKPGCTMPVQTWLLENKRIARYVAKEWIVVATPQIKPEPQPVVVAEPEPTPAVAEVEVSDVAYSEASDVTNEATTTPTEEIKFKRRKKVKLDENPQSTGSDGDLHS